MNAKRRISSFFLGALLIFSTLMGCQPKNKSEGSKIGDLQTLQGNGKGTLKIISGSENKEISPVLEDFVKESGITLQMEYKGSLDIMNQLGQADVGYDAVWPASSLWISLGDVNHKVKHLKSTSLTPVVFGIRKSLAQSLDFVDQKVTMKQLLEAISEGKLKFSMTSATQSNSGASAYLAFLHALAGSPAVLTKEHLADPALQASITKLLGGVDRSSGSSEWLKTLFLQGDFDAMVNYEALIITTNRELEAQGKEPLYMVYPEDGLALADSPLGFIDGSKEEDAFLKLQEYLDRPEVQSKIQSLGRRTGFEGVKAENKKFFPANWGAQPDRVLSPIKTPAADTIKGALDLYQTSFRKPSLTYYVLDYSGSMSGAGQQQLVLAMEAILVQEKAKQQLLQASPKDKNYIHIYSDEEMNFFESDGNADHLADLYQKVRGQSLGGGTDIFGSVKTAIERLSKEDLSGRNPAIIVMSDGQHNGRVTFREVKNAYEAMPVKVPIFAITFGSADDKELKQMTDLSGGRVFDGKTNLVEAFKKVKGYN